MRLLNTTPLHHTIISLLHLIISTSVLVMGAKVLVVLVPRSGGKSILNVGVYFNIFPNFLAISESGGGCSNKIWCSHKILSGNKI